MGRTRKHYVAIRRPPNENKDAVKVCRAWGFLIMHRECVKKYEVRLVETETGIGVNSTMFCDACQEKRDVTNYDLW